MLTLSVNLYFMDQIDNLFFELLRVAIGTQESLSHVPSVREWEELYHIAQKQALIGICFAGLQKLYGFDNSESTKNP